MREAVGGSLLLYLLIPIILVIIAFIGFIMNYAAAYRAANHVITRIENCQGRFGDCGADKQELSKTNLTKEIGSAYSYTLPEEITSLPLCYVLNGNNTYIFRIELPIWFDLPLYGKLTLMRVRAETKSIPNVPTKSLSGIAQCS